MTLIWDLQLTDFQGTIDSRLCEWTNLDFDIIYDGVEVIGAKPIQMQQFEHDINVNVCQPSSVVHDLLVLSNEVSEQSNAFYGENSNNDLTVCEAAHTPNEGLEQSRAAYEGIILVGESEVPDCDGLNIQAPINSVNGTSSISPTGLLANQPNLQEAEQSYRSNVAINFSELSCHDKIFRSSFDFGVDMCDFGVSDQSFLQNQSKLSKLTQKIRRDVRELALFCAANEKQKLVNVLIINQQLNVIDPPYLPLEEAAKISSETRTIETILRPPTMPQRVKAEAHRNIKVGYGVATAEEVLEHIAEREILDGQHEIEREEDEIEKNAREKEIDGVEKQLRETRKFLIDLRSVTATYVKEAAQKKKSKKGGNGHSESSFLDDTISEKKIEIDAKNDELKNLREQLKALKADHTAANKAVAAKRKNDIQIKKERGNTVIPPLVSDNK